MLATGGDSALGGDDFDRLLADYLMQQLSTEDRSAAQQRGIIALGRRLKEALTEHPSVTADLGEIMPDGPTLTVDRETLNTLCAPLINRSLDACRRCIADGRCRPH